MTLLKKYKPNSYYKLEFKILKSQLHDILNIFENETNISWFENNHFWKFSFLKEKKSELIYFKECLEKKFKIKSQIFILKNRNWLLENQKNDHCIKTELFSISQGINIFQDSNLKYKIIIPASNAFGTGNHESTFLVIRGIEFLLKLKKFKNILDIGTGTGILAFVLNKITRKKIYASDFDKSCINTFKRNRKLNNLNNLKFIRTEGFKHPEFRKEKFELIVSNILLQPLVRLSKDIKHHLKPRGYLILSGILEKQINDLFSFYSSLNFVIIKKITMNNWLLLILKKNA